MLKHYYALSCYFIVTGLSGIAVPEKASAQTALQQRLDAAFKASQANVPPPPGATIARGSPLDEKAKDLEAFYLRKMLEQAFPEGEESGLYGGGEGSQFFRSMQIDNMATSWSDSGGIGLRERIVKEYTQRNGAYGERTPGNARLLMEGGRQDGRH